MTHSPNFHPQSLSIDEFDYPLPDERIAQHPLAERDASRLLVYHKGAISQSRFSKISEFIPSDTLLLFNDTRVFQARLIFHKETGARIEIFCLEPAPPTADYQIAFSNRGECYWKCLIGNNKKWKSGVLTLPVSVNEKDVILRAEKVSQTGETSVIRFSWEPEELSFAVILDQSGVVPLPPYIHHQASPEDKERYQTIYARLRGSVAAPTAGLHFTKRVFQSLASQNISTAFVTLHVGAGTFKPVSALTLGGHEMHAEQISITSTLLEQLVKLYGEKGAGRVFPVGTTSMRTIESFYWLGVRKIKGKMDEAHPFVHQWDPYDPELDTAIPVGEAMSALLEHLKETGNNQLIASTQLIIAPGYRYRIASGLITNFHQPRSTLLLLVSALIGEDWKKVYDYALGHDFRFLSYGDSCLLMP
ncbi:MAG: S-adenosylmethionine:tRNA ribosyltransferase-isomerase [Bacteroidota bacterium]|nr:S-adenosylmethionine:tRNA ribosyltransferase-isomerase [Bacteroidota bacterium]